MGEELESQRSLDELEAVIESGVQRLLKLSSEALLEIHDRQLYKASCSSFEDYCERRWGFSRRTGYRMLEQGRQLALERDDMKNVPSVPRSGEAAGQEPAPRHTSQREAARRAKAQRQGSSSEPATGSGALPIEAVKPAPVIDATAREKPAQLELFAFLDEDPAKAAGAMDVDHRLVARKLRRWADDFETAAKGAAVVVSVAPYGGPLRTDPPRKAPARPAPKRAGARPVATAKKPSERKQVQPLFKDTTKGKR